MLSLLKKKESIVLYAPVTGAAIPIENVPDKVFASKMMGDGIAFEFEGDIVYAPCDATVTMIANTLHAIGLKLSNGAEVLIHIGLDTVDLQGVGFEKLVEKSSKVNIGMRLIKIDREVIKQNKINMITPMVITNRNGNEYVFCHEKDINSYVIMNETKLIEFK